MSTSAPLPARLQIECGDSLSPINGRVSVRGGSFGPSLPLQTSALPTPGGSPLIDVSPRAGSVLPARTQAGRGRIPAVGCGEASGLAGYT